ncbi:MAG: dihydrodipicolinate synthase family protein [Rubrobacter sp.]|nr:dihydrodipicolinate synthase family protein [Rubrobacteraceae bacterium]MDQ3251453.1 dihydrodipicolinate synthase family protein [Actinomycetota bacterium]MDQ3437435.1 dihydrodipicolinate synthase family protein [Actinomycetota bacterium]
MESKERSSVAGPKGVLAAVLTPMDEDLKPNHQAFAAHCHRLLAAGCHGLSVFGTTGEANSLSVNERLAALEGLLDSGVPVETLLPGTGSCALTDTVRLSRAALEAGAAGVLVLPPFYYKGVGDDGLFRFFAEVVERVGDDRLRLYLYHIPQMTGVDLGLPLISRLIEAYPGVVVGTKDSSGDRERIMTLCREFPELSVLAGTESLLLETLRGGGEGCISATVNVTSRLARRVHDAHASGKDDEAEALQERLTQVRMSIETYPVIPALKQLMTRLTGDEQWRNIRPPLSGLDEKRTIDLLSNVPLSELL